LALSNFFVFGYVKHYLNGYSDPSKKALLDAIHTVVKEISGTTLKATFRNWMERLVWVIAHGGHDYPSSRSWLIYFYLMSLRNRDTQPSLNTLDVDNGAG
jgi:hypothetical protein